MAKIFNFYLKNLVPDTGEWDERDMFTVGRELKSLFDKVCQLPTTEFTASDWWINPGAGEIADHELLIYFVGDSSKSIIKQAHPNKTVDLTKSGNTDPGHFRISEVYVLPILKYVDYHLTIANLCFHELMHNKLEPFNVHNQGGGGLAAESAITASTQLTDKNKELMAKALNKRVLQYKGAL